MALLRYQKEFQIQEDEQDLALARVMNETWQRGTSEESLNAVKGRS